MSICPSATVTPPLLPSPPAIKVPLDVTVPVTDKAEPVNVRFVSAFPVPVPDDVITLLSPSLETIKPPSGVFATTHVKPPLA